VFSTVEEAKKSILEQVESIRKLAAVASRYPYYKYNSMWTRDMQNAVGSTTEIMGRRLLTDDSALPASSAVGSIATGTQVNS